MPGAALNPSRALTRLILTVTLQVGVIIIPDLQVTQPSPAGQQRARISEPAAGRPGLAQPGCRGRARGHGLELWARLSSGTRVPDCACAEQAASLNLPNESMNAAGWPRSLMEGQFAWSGREVSQGAVGAQR